MSSSPAFRTLALAALLGGLAALPAYAAATTNITQGGPPSATNSTSISASDEENGTSESAAPASMSNAMSAHVEQRIKTLHDKLQITADQQSDWQDVAQAMRDNETNISQLIQDRHANGSTMNAVEDLQSYQRIAQAHADGLAKLIPAFQTLYNDMSDAQKKNADEVFGRFEGHRGVAKASAHHRAKKSTATPAPSTEQ